MEGRCASARQRLNPVNKCNGPKRSMNGPKLLRNSPKLKRNGPKMRINRPNWVFCPSCALPQPDSSSKPSYTSYIFLSFKKVGNNKYVYQSWNRNIVETIFLMYIYKI